MLGLLTQFASSSGIGALGLNLQSFLIQLGTFIIAFLALRQWAFKPILKVLRERRETIDKGVELGQQMQKEKDELEAKVTETLHKARQQADEIVSAARSDARQAAQAAEEDARVKAKSIVDEASARIKQDTESARRKLGGELAGLVSDATEAIIHEKVDAKKDAGLIERALKGRA